MPRPPPPRGLQPETWAATALTCRDASCRERYVRLGSMMGAIGLHAHRQSWLARPCHRPFAGAATGCGRVRRVTGLAVWVGLNDEGGAGRTFGLQNRPTKINLMGPFRNHQTSMDRWIGFTCTLGSSGSTHLPPPPPPRGTAAHAPSRDFRAQRELARERLTRRPASHGRRQGSTGRSGDGAACQVVFGGRASGRATAC